MDKKYTFKELCTEPVVIDDEKKLSAIFDYIKIPKIQRDYAQGRKKGEELNVTGKKFLDNIFEHLEKDQPMELDFVYGTVSSYDSEGTKKYNLLPLDGQQRITTLFLLYWFLGLKENGSAPEFLKKFTYETRASSSDFCEYICDSTKTKIDISKKPSDELENCWWFVKSSKFDPTIKAMVNMMDYIFEKYGQNREIRLYDRLENLKFYVLTLNGYKLTEDLYIKMNARGKQLTNFENFKADLVKWMRDQNNTDSKLFESEVEEKDKNRKIPYYLLLSSKIDNEWTNYFWNICKKTDVNKTDIMFLKFIKRYFKCVYCLNYKKDARGIIYEATFKAFDDENDYIDFKPFTEILNYEEIKYFALILDSLSKNYISDSTLLTSSWGDTIPLTSVDFFEEMTQSRTLIFWGVCLYFRVGGEFCVPPFLRWMRIIWNIIENTNIDGWGPGVSAIKLLNELSRYSHDIYSYLGSIQFDQLQIKSSGQAVKEEILKCKLINKDPAWEDLLLKSEKHQFFKGAVGFLLEPHITKEVFKHRLEMATLFFDERGIAKKYQKYGHIFLRALISECKTASDILGKRFTDTDEAQHFLKLKMAGFEDNIVAPALRKWFDLPDETAISKCLFESVKRDSNITGGYSNNTPEENQTLKIIHEKLYKDEDLQNWMQEHKAIFVNRNGKHIYVWRPRAWYEWIQLDGFRNELAAEIMKNSECTTDNRWYIGAKPTNYFLGNGAVEIKRNILIKDVEVLFVYKIDDSTLTVGFKKSELLEEKLKAIFPDKLDHVNHELKDIFSDKVDGWRYAKVYDDYQNILKTKDIKIFLKEIDTFFRFPR